MPAPEPDHVFIHQLQQLQQLQFQRKQKQIKVEGQEVETDPGCVLLVLD